MPVPSHVPDAQEALQAGAASSLTDAQALSCATELFLERGITAVKMTDIAEAAGVGVATLYRHFSTKTAIAAASGTLLWKRLVDDYERLSTREDYLACNGAQRLERLLQAYCQRYLYRPGFAGFLDDLDRLLLDGDVSGGAVDDYTLAVAAAYPYYERAYQLGCQDGSIAPETDFELFYRSVAHALLSVAGKLSRGDVLPTDDFSVGREELDCLVDVAIRSLATR